MDFLHTAASELEKYVQLHAITTPLSPQSIELLKSWKNTTNLCIETLPEWSLETADFSLVTLTGVVQDQQELEMVLSFYIENERIYSTKYGRVPNSVTTAIEDIYTVRHPLKIIPVPGTVAPKYPRVLLYSDLKEYPLNSIISVAGIYAENELHIIQSLPQLLPQTHERHRTELLQLLTGLLGDSCAAELLLYNLLSKVQVRSGLVGHFPLNLSNVTDPKPILHCLSALIGTAHVPLTLSLLNSVSFKPTKVDEEFPHTPLQLPDHTLVVLDETALAPGPLTATGQENIQILTNLVENQTLRYNFNSSEIEFPTDLKILVLSQGKSILPLPLRIPISGVPMTSAVPLHLKHYIEAASRLTSTITAEVSTLAEEYFMSSRLSPERLHRVLTLSRYIGQSYLSSSARPQHWTHSLSLFPS